MWHKLFPDEINLHPTRAALVEKFKVSQLVDDDPTAPRDQPCPYASLAKDLMPAVSELAVVAPLVVISAVASILWPNVGVILAPVTALGLLFTSPVWMMIFALLMAVGVMALHPDWVFGNLNYTMGAVAVIAFMVAGSLFVPRVKAAEPLDDAPSPKPAAASATPAASASPKAATPTAPAKPKFKPVAFDKTIAASGITLVFGTESGNAEGLSQLAAQQLQADGHAVQVLDAQVVDICHLRAFANLLVITSTWGDGDPPGNAIDLTAGIKAATGPNLSGTQFSVCGLGDTNYEQFCQCAKDFDAGLAKFGGHRLTDRQDCNVDFDAPFKAWLDKVKGAFKASGLKSVASYDETEDLKALGLLDTPAIPDTAPVPAEPVTA